MKRPHTHPVRRPVAALMATLPMLLAEISWSQTPPAQTPSPAPGAPEPSELAALRRTYTLRALAAGRMLAEQYTNALATLETQAANQGDYETAIAAQRRRQDLADVYARHDSLAAPVITLKPADARTVGAVTLDKSENSLVNWRTAGSSATWDIFKIEPGSYTVSLVYGLADSGQASPAVVFAGGAAETLTGGEVEFSEITGLIGAEAQKLTAALESTGAWNTFETVTLGNIKLARTSARLTLKATRLRGTGGLMHFKEVQLSPARPAPAGPDTDASTEIIEELEKTRTAHREKLLELGQPILSAHLARLAELGDSLAARKDEDGAQAVAVETRRARKMLEEPEATVRTGPAAVSAEGMEEIADARYVDDPANTGDRFLVAARGEQLSVRLMHVSCPSPEIDDKTGDSLFTSYFRISKEDRVALGRQAKEFTAAYLKDKPLRLLTRGQKDRHGSLLAIVLPAEVGSFAGILVDYGLAAIPPPTGKPASRRIDENALADLKEREDQARSRPVPPGGWALAAEAQPAP